MRTILSAVTVAVAAALLAGCGGDGKEDAKAAPAKRGATAVASSAQPQSTAAGGLDGTWKPINKSPIATLTISGTTVTTTGKLACSGTVKGAGTAKASITLCANEQGREKGTIDHKPGANRFVINWDGPAWGGDIDSFTKAS
ncbi:hypothetical protein [Actinomadura fibrosa]|uniref:Lipoprotein n=1 Tax=Actinomadura fibrosa TaxID=111802 RepID=A0ABW2X9Z9_9ACTN|nr:hypothetical protein [Actinomadura fibrosa]